ncbi:hypothetical protein FBU30_004139 [Linnemannia zychae]|nr:hypothetical protein FBU30_004139 [Linnemannia zychae]
MAESESKPIHIKGDEDGDQDEILYRAPEPVPPSEEFFNRPALVFNPDSMPLKENESGLFVSAEESEVGTVQTTSRDEQQEEDAQNHATNDSNIEAVDNKDTQDASPANNNASSSTARSDVAKADLERLASAARLPLPSSPQDLKNTTTASVPTRSIFEQSVNAPTFRTSLGISNNSDFNSRIAEKTVGEKVHDEATEDNQEVVETDGVDVVKPTTLFPAAQPDHGLVLATKSSENDDQNVPDEDTEDIPISYPSLSELSQSGKGNTTSRQLFEPSTSANISTLPESTNAKRWDIDDDEETSDADIDLDFAKTRSKESQDSEDSLSPVVPQTTITDSRVSPFAAFLDAAPLKSLIQDAKDELLGSGPEDKDTTTSQAKDESDLDLKDFMGTATALAGGALLARKLLQEMDSVNKDGSNDVDLASLLREPLSKFLESQSRPVASERSSTSDDDKSFDGGVGGIGAIGAAVISFLDSSSQYSDTSDNKPSESIVPKYSAAEKGKQVIRDDQLVPTTQHEILDDLPPINSLSGKTFGNIGSAPVLGMISPTTIPPPVTTTEGPRTRIYPPPPPEPWAPSPLTSTLSQRRSPIANVKTDTADAKDPFNHDPNLDFAILPRKTDPPKPAEGVKSLLSDYPDIVTKQPVAAPKTVTLPADPSKAPVLRGRYELPSISKVDQWKSKNTLAPNVFKRLIVNIIALIVSTRVMKGRIYKSCIGLLSSFVNHSIIYWTEWAVIIVLLFNIAEIIYSYTRRPNNFESLPLTPSQRSLLGLEPVVSKVPGAVPVFKKSTIAPQNLTEKPIMSTYVSPQASLPSSRSAFQKPAVSSISSEYKDAATILNKSMSRAFNATSIQDKAGVKRLMRNMEAREELMSEWKGVDSDPSKRAFGLHSTFGASQTGLHGGIDMSHTGMADSTRPDLLASLNSRGPVGRYQPALRTTLSKDSISKRDLQKDGLHVYGYNKVLKSLKVSEDQLDKWSFNLRNWLWNRIVKVVCSEMDEVDAEFAKQGLSYLDCKSATMFYTSGPLPQNATTNGSSASTTAAPAAPAAAPMANSLGWGAASIASARLPSAFGPAVTQPQQPQMPTSLQDLDIRYGQTPIVRRRMVLELYLAIPGFANRKYVVERLKALGPLLSHFSWDSTGVTWEGGRKTWTQDLPTDSQIIMHLFTVYMDLAMPPQPSQSFDRFPFSYRHYVPMEAKPDATTSLQIKQTAKYPPNYDLVVDGAMWEVVPKRLNVWYTLVIFIFMVMKEHGGYIGQINIGTRAVGLGDVVEGYDD